MSSSNNNSSLHKAFDAAAAAADTNTNAKSTSCVTVGNPANYCCQKSGDVNASAVDNIPVKNVAVDNVSVKNVVDKLDSAKDDFMSGENEIEQGRDEMRAVMYCFVADSTKKTFPII